MAQGHQDETDFQDTWADSSGRPSRPSLLQTWLPLDEAASSGVHFDSMRGFVPTPPAVVDAMVSKLFDGAPPTKASTLLDPGCGTGAFLDGVLRWCTRLGAPVPKMVGIESEPGRSAVAAAHFRKSAAITILKDDFLQPSSRSFDYIIANPPYVSITQLTEREKAKYRAAYSVARGRFDLYLLFFEQALRQLKPGGRLVFLTPEKFLYVDTARPLRELLGKLDLQEIRLIDEQTFKGLATYPTITVIANSPTKGRTRIVRRDGSESIVAFPSDGASLQPLLQGHRSAQDAGPTLEDVCLRVSCGVATGADGIFVQESRRLTPALQRFAYPTVSGRELVAGWQSRNPRHSMLVPYDEDGQLLPLNDLGELGGFLSAKAQRERLSKRTCVLRKPWYAFHDSVPLHDILRPKLLCKDIASLPNFWIDSKGKLVPRHSVYYLVPRDPERLGDLAGYLHSKTAQAWMKAHCQRASNGFLRLQSAVLKRLPVPAELAQA
jgi:tRNA1(Val) A37 N6-methylase TrmN6